MFMHWFREHPYATVLAIATVVLLVGAYIVKERTGVPPDSSSTIAWGGGGGYLFPTLGTDNNVSSETERDSSNLYRQIQGGPPFVYSTAPSLPGEETSAEGGLELDTLINMLSPEKTSSSGTPPVDNSLLENAYLFIPRGFITTSIPTQTYTPAQEALRNYGNDAGAYIKSFEETNQNEKMTRILKDQFEDPQSPTKAEALKDLANDLASVGNSLEKMSSVPEQVASTNARLAASYQAMGAKLALVPNAQRDEEKIDAMLAYNATVEEFIRSYIALTTLLSLSEITFRTDEPGSVFMFTNASL